MGGFLGFNHDLFQGFRWFFFPTNDWEVFLTITSVGRKTSGTSAEPVTQLTSLRVSVRTYRSFLWCFVEDSAKSLQSCDERLDLLPVANGGIGWQQVFLKKRFRCSPNPLAWKRLRVLQSSKSSHPNFWELKISSTHRAETMATLLLRFASMSYVWHLGVLI